jgi:beta-phosphoglucomutase
MSRLAVIFDVDGVLVDSYQAHFQSWKQALGEIGVQQSEDEFAASFGRTSREILRQKLGPDLDEARLSELDDRKETLYRQLFNEFARVMEGATELLDALVADGFLLGVGSSGPAANVGVALELIGRRHVFASIVTGADVTRGKPDPQVFELAAERLGVPAQACAVVEDAVAGIEAANRAGMTSIALTGTATRDRLGHARLVVDSLHELTPMRVRALLTDARGSC